MEVSLKRLFYGPNGGAISGVINIINTSGLEYCGLCAATDGGGRMWIERVGESGRRVGR